MRFEIEATIGQKFEIPTTYFNESGDARIKIVLPDGTYFTHTADNILYDTFHLRVRASSDINFNPPVAALGVPFASQGYVDTAIAALGIPFTHSLVEQVWPFEKWIGGGDIFVMSFSLGTTTGAMVTLTGFNIAQTSRIVKTISQSWVTAISSWVLDTITIENNGGADWQYLSVAGRELVFITVYYTKP